MQQERGEDADSSESEDEVEEVDSLSESVAESCYTGVQSERDSDVEDDASAGSSSIDSDLTTESIESEQEEEEEAQSDSVTSSYRNGSVQLQKSAGTVHLSDPESASTESDWSIESDDSVAESIESDSVDADSIESEQEKIAEPDNVISNKRTDEQSQNMDVIKFIDSESEPEQDECDLEGFSNSCVDHYFTFATQNTVVKSPDEMICDSGGSLSVRSVVTKSNRVVVADDVTPAEPEGSINHSSDINGPKPMDTKSESRTETSTVKNKKLDAEVISERHDMKASESTVASSDVTGVTCEHHTFESVPIEHHQADEESNHHHLEVNDTSLLEVTKGGLVPDNLSVRELVNELLGSSFTIANVGDDKEEVLSKKLNGNNKEEEGEPLPFGNGETKSCCDSRSTTRANGNEEQHEEVTGL